MYGGTHSEGGKFFFLIFLRPLCSHGRVESKTPVIIIHPSARKKSKRLEVPNAILLGSPNQIQTIEDGEDCERPVCSSSVRGNSKPRCVLCEYGHHGYNSSPRYGASRYLCVLQWQCAANALLLTQPADVDFWCTSCIKFKCWAS